MDEELPELTLEETQAKMLEFFNKGEFDKGVGVWVYYKLGQEDFIEKIEDAILEAVKKFLDIRTMEKLE